MSRGEGDKKQKHRQRLEALKQKTQRKVDYHLQKAYVNAFDFYDLIKEFFLELLEKRYEPTYEELMEDLDELKHEYLMFTKNQRAEAKKLLSRLSESEYTSGQMTQDEAKSILKAFKDLALRLTTFEEGSIEQELHRGFIILESGDREGANTAYSKARSLYEKLPDTEKIKYYQDLQELYNAVN